MQRDLPPLCSDRNSLRTQHFKLVLYAQCTYEASCAAANGIVIEYMCRYVYLLVWCCVASTEMHNLLLFPRRSFSVE